MADRLLLSGYGGAYTSEQFSASSTTGSDTIDASRAGSLVVQVSSASNPAGTFDIEQTFNGSDWADLFTGISIADGIVQRLTENDGPFGRLRIDATNISSGTATITIIGFPRSDMGW